MVTAKRTLLIVEDDPILSTLYKLNCETALRELPHLEAGLIQAFNYQQAKQILETQPVDFLSVDIALTPEEQGKTDQQRAVRDAGGMALLKELLPGKKHPLAVVVSGETLQSYAIDAYRTYGVLAFYQKDRFNDEEYRHALKAAMFFLDANQLISQAETELDLEAAWRYWHKALEAGQRANIREHDFPEDMGTVIELALSKRTHTITRLPNTHWLEDIFRAKIIRRSDWALLRVTITGFSQFVDTYASQEEPILFFVAQLLKSIRGKFNDQALFIGHLGYHDAEPGFVLIPSQKSLNRLPEMARWLEDEFERTGARPFTQEIAGAGQPALTFTLTTKTLSGTEDNFQDLHELLDKLRSPEL